MIRSRAIGRMNRVTIFSGLGLCILFLQSDFALAAVEWLPPEPVFPRALADPLEPRMGITYSPAPDHLEASLGAPLPVSLFSVRGAPVIAALEVGSFFRLDRDGAIFPLESFDGRVGVALETRVLRFHSRLRLMHWSAHKADGDTSVSFRSSTFSRESWTLDVGWQESGWDAYIRVGSAWHSVPSDPGLRAALGGTWYARASGLRPFVSLHLAADHRRNWRVTQSLVAGFETGKIRWFRLGVRLFRGHSPRGQYWDLVERHAGLEMQFSP